MRYVLYTITYISQSEFLTQWRYSLDCRILEGLDLGAKASSQENSGAERTVVNILCR